MTPPATGKTITGPNVSGTKRLIFATTELVSLVSLRAALITETIRRRHKVFIIAPSAEAAAIAALERLGATVIVTPFEGRSFNPIHAYRVRRDLVGRLTSVAPHTIAFCDAPAAVAMVPAALKARVGRRVAMLSRLPHGDMNSEMRPLQLALSNVTAFVVETPEEKRSLTGAKWLDDPVEVFVAPSSGIDSAAQNVLPLPPFNDGFVFALVSTPNDTGAQETFRAAAAHLSIRAPLARFVISDERNSVGAATIASAHAVVHASSVDGLTTGLLQGLAAGRPVITTDVAAARDTVDERVNGCRVPIGDAVALADAMASVMKRLDLVPAMARASRLKAERRYDLAAVNRITLDAFGLDDTFAVAAA